MVLINTGLWLPATSQTRMLHSAKTCSLIHTAGEKSSRNARPMSEFWLKQLSLDSGRRNCDTTSAINSRSHWAHFLHKIWLWVKALFLHQLTSKQCQRFFLSFLLGCLLAAKFNDDSWRGQNHLSSWGQGKKWSVAHKMEHDITLLVGHVVGVDQPHKPFERPPPKWCQEGTGINFGEHPHKNIQKLYTVYRPRLILCV